MQSADSRHPRLLRERLIRRVLLSAPLLAALSCAQDPALKAELVDLRSELRAIRERDQGLEKRLERMETLQALLTARPGGPSGPSFGAPSSGAGATPALKDPRPENREVPDLTVVKLKPKADPAPRLATSVPVVEPSPEAIEALVQAVPDADPPAQPLPQAMLDAEFERGVEALRTGNVEGGVLRLTRFADENPRHPKADNALYFSGIGLIGMEDYRGAAHALERLLKDYPAGDAVVDALLKLAECRVRLNRPVEAKALYGEVITHYPGTAAATQAESRLASLP